MSPCEATPADFYFEGADAGFLCELTFQVFCGDEAERHHEGDFLQKIETVKVSRTSRWPEVLERISEEEESLTSGSSSFLWEGDFGAGGASWDGSSAWAPGEPSVLLGACGWIMIT